MTDRDKLKKELKEDCKKAFNAFVRGAKKAIVYTMLITSAGGITSKEDAKLNEVKQEYKQAQIGQERLEQRLSENTYWLNENMFTPYLEPTAEEKANYLYQQISQETASTNISLQNMVDKAGVTQEDIQTLISQNPAMLADIIPGKTNKSLAKASDRVKGGGQGHCLSGVQIIFDNAGLTGILSGKTAEWPEKIGGCRSNSACNAYYPLEKSGKFMTVSIENKAYNTNAWSEENKEMRAFVRNLPAGTIVITENKIADEYQGRSYRDLARRYGSGGGIHGHITVKSNKGSYNSDIIEPNGPNFAKYGENVLISLPKDIELTPEQSKELIKISQERQNKLAKSNNKNPFYYNNYLDMLGRG